MLASLERTASYARLARHAISLRRATDDEVRTRAQQYVTQTLGRLRGLPQKLGQILSLSLDNAAEDAANPYQSLQEHGEALPLEVVLPILADQWRCDPYEVLAVIEPNALAGSLGQVHRATTHDGRTVAVKVQYPGIERAIATDLKLLGWLSAPVGGLRRGFDMAAYRTALLENLDREIDYEREADWHRRFADLWAGTAASVPTVLDELSTSHVLVTTWAEGDTWESVRDTWSDSERRQLANKLIEFVLRGLLVDGAMQADWHPGNLRFRRDGGRVRIAMFDLGCIFEPTDDERLALARLIRATIHGDESPWPLLLKLGFDAAALEPLAGKLPALCRVLFEPFCTDAPYDLSTWHLSERIADVLGDDRWNFRIAAPARLLLLMRTLHGLVYYLRGLGPPVFWQRPFEQIASELDAQLNALDLPAASGPNCQFDCVARYLKIRISENGRTKVAITSSASAIEDLDALLGDDLRDKIRSRGIELPQIVADVRRRGYSPGVVFNMAEGAKRVEVTLA